MPLLHSGNKLKMQTMNFDQFCLQELQIFVFQKLFSIAIICGNVVEHNPLEATPESGKV